MFSRLNLGDVGLFIGLFLFVIWSAFLITQNTRLKQQNSELTYQVQQFKQQEMATKQRLLKLQEMTELATKTAEKNTALYQQQKKALEVANEKYKTWANKLVPDDVIRVLNENHEYNTTDCLSDCDKLR